MFDLSAANVRMAATATSKEDAIRQVGQLLVDAGVIAPGYIESMLLREQQANTYLGNGIAIPHGMEQQRNLIRRTGVAVLQLPAGVAWKDQAPARLVIGIAARTDEHLTVLSNLVDVLADPILADQLATTRDSEMIVRLLTRPRTAGQSATQRELVGALTAQVRVASPTGLHARPATVLAEMAAGFAAEIQLGYAGRTANAKSLAALLQLGAPHGAAVTLSVQGPDAAAALETLRTALESGLEDEAPAALEEEGPLWQPASLGRMLHGVAASPGIAIGPLFRYRTQRLLVRDAAGDARQERQQLRAAASAARVQLDELHTAVAARAGRSEAAIFRAHQALLDDPDLLAEADALIDAGHSAAWSWQQLTEARVAALQQVDDQRLAARAADLYDVGQRMLRLLVPGEAAASALPEGPVILLAEDLLPSDTARLDPHRTLGLCTAAGGPTAHTAIIARALGIPCVVGAGPELLTLPDGALGILDGAAGALYIEPQQADLDQARAAQEELARRRDAAYRTRFQPALTTDGQRIEVVANVQRPAEASQALDSGAEGIGLMRTEFLFLEREQPPSEEEQYEAYRSMAEALNGLPLIIRTLDIGGDKAVPYLNLPHEDNPFLGVRGIRLCLRRPELFRPQLRAIYRAASLGAIKLMFPMVATLEELREAKALAEQVRQELGAPPVEIGIMVEVPSVVMLAEEFAREVDFFSIGTNDLTQYALATDRLHPLLAKQVDALHPAVLRMIDRTVRAADAAGRWVGVCGGIASDPRGALLLAGLGVSELSMSIPSIPAVKARLRNTSMAHTRALARRALACATADEVRGLRLEA